MSYYYPGYNEARARVKKQSRAEDLDLIDMLFGRDNLIGSNWTDDDVKAEALRQMEIEWRDREVNL